MGANVDMVSGNVVHDFGEAKLSVSYESSNTGSHPILSCYRAVLHIRMGVGGLKISFAFTVFPRTQ